MSDFSRVREKELVLPTLEILAEQPDGFLSTANLIEALEMKIQPVGKDAEILETRNDTFFSQKVRNLVSHRAGDRSFITRGYAEYDSVRHGFRITNLGRTIPKNLNS